MAGSGSALGLISSDAQGMIAVWDVEGGQSQGTMQDGNKAILGNMHHAISYEYFSKITKFQQMLLGFQMEELPITIYLPFILPILLFYGTCGHGLNSGRKPTQKHFCHLVWTHLITQNLLVSIKYKICLMVLLTICLSLQFSVKIVFCLWTISPWVVFPRVMVASST
jgi:hypothetical protein